jgi:hypothetical protein
MYEVSEEAKREFNDIEIPRICFTCKDFDRCSHGVAKQFSKMVTHDMGIVS